MSQATDRVRWTTADLELLPDNGTRYESIDGDLYVTRAPHWKHQRTIVRICSELDAWSRLSNLGETVSTPGIVFSDADNVIPDVVWVSRDRLTLLLDSTGHLTGAPELVVEVLSPGTENERRDREAKLKLYGSRGVQEYWIINWQLQQVEVFRRETAVLALAVTLFATDNLISSLLPGFVCPVNRLFA